MATNTNGASPDKRRKYDEAFKAEALRLANESRSTQAAALDGGYLPGLTDAKFEISHHIAHYNAERRHSSLGYQSPNNFEAQLKTTSQLCPA